MSAKGSGGFNTYYRGVYGHRWAVLAEALTRGPTHVAWDQGLREPYYLDPASVAAGYLLPLAGAERVLDLCAAPGGKTLVLAGRMDPAAQLVANERSRRRRARLLRVLDAHLPAPLRARVQVTGHDASRWGLHEPAYYDAVLADVPCSSEQHVLADPAELERWSRSRIKRLSVQQGAILAAAVDSARPGGFILYVTCAVTPEENDAVVARILRKRSESVAPVASDHLTGAAAAPVGAFPAVAAALERAEPTDYGIHILPDTAAGAGPLYCALLRRR